MKKFWELWNKFHLMVNRWQVSSLTRRGIPVPASLLPPTPQTPPQRPSIIIAAPVSGGAATTNQAQAPTPAPATGDTPATNPAVPPTQATTGQTAGQNTQQATPAGKKYDRFFWIQIGIGVILLAALLVWTFMPGKKTPPASDVKVLSTPSALGLTVRTTRTAVTPTTENILDEYVDPKGFVGGELEAEKFVQPGNGRIFLKPDGWSVTCTVWASAHDGTQYSRLINVGSIDEPNWVNNDNPVPVKVKGFWVKYKGDAKKLPPEGMRVVFTLKPDTQ